ncbi:MAG: response regulator [Candidatus Pacebacteria bacterium]|nr:response regulator [Candidatus Paceibacterota bacterium]MBP9866538.1 response regulator [Candidatus Paceibacterota bacterium]
MKKIMIIEDNKDIQNIYKHSFEKAGYEVIIEDNGLEGINNVVQKMPDVILLDLMMPKMDGFEFLKLMKQNSTLNIPVIVCSNISDNEIYAKVMDFGAAAIILKVDYSGKQLVEKVEYIMKDLHKI